jgi:hypothetical protein
MFVRLLNELEIGPSSGFVDTTHQHRVTSELAETWHEWTQALYKDGAVLHRLIDQLGTQLSARLHSRRERDDDIQEETNRFFVDLQTVPPRHAEAFRVGARHGLLVAEASGSSLRYPVGMGVWRLSYALAPKFWLLTRRGRIAKLEETQLEFGFDDRADPDVSLTTEAAHLADPTSAGMEDV